MSYRDETLVLRERLLTLDAEHAQLEGTARGLRFRSACADDELESLERTLRIEGVKGGARRVSYRLVSVVVGLVLLALTCLVSGGLIHACTNVSETVEAQVSPHRASTGDCHVEIRDALFGACSAKAWCDDGLVWEGTGTCDEGTQGIQFWSDESASDDRFTYVRGAVARAVFRPAGGETIVLHLPGGRGL